MKKYDYEKSEKDYIAEEEEFGASNRSSFLCGKQNQLKGNDFFKRAMMLTDSKGNFIFYTLIHFIGTFLAEAAVCLLFGTEKQSFLISGAAGALLGGTVCAVIREKVKVKYAAAANIVLFLIWTMYFFILASGISAFLFGVQL